MPNQIIEIPGVGPVEFPDTMSDADVSVAAKKLHADAEANLDKLSTPTDVAHLPASQSVPGILGGMGSQLLNTVKALPSAAYNLATTNPMESVPAMVKGMYHEPGAIKEQFAKGTPKDVGEAMMRTVMMMAPVGAAAKGTAGLVAKAAKTPVGAAVKAAVGETPIISAPIKAAAKAYKAAKATPEEGLLSPEADALRASTKVTGPATGPIDRGRSATPPVQPPVPAVVDTPVSARARAAQATEADAARLRQHTADAEMTPPNTAAPLQHDSQAIRDIMRPEAQAAIEEGFRQNNPVFRQMQRDGTFGERGTMEAEMAQRAEMAAREAQTVDLARGSRLTPDEQTFKRGPQPISEEDAALSTMEVVEPEAAINAPGSRLGQESVYGRPSIDPEVEAIAEQMRARTQPQTSPVPSHVGGHQAEAVPGSPRTARSVYEPGGSQALTEEELMQLLYDIEQNRRP